MAGGFSPAWTAFEKMDKTVTRPRSQRGVFPVRVCAWGGGGGRRARCGLGGGVVQLSATKLPWGAGGQNTFLRCVRAAGQQRATTVGVRGH